MNQISIDDILEIHRHVVSEFGGIQGVRDLGRVESVIAAQSQEVFGEEIYPSIYEKSAAIMRGIIQDHPFVDGNKRTAVVATVSLLLWNGCKFSADKGELEDFAVKVATDKLDVKNIANWLKAHCN
jgi:death-on-curing protein